MEEFRIYVDKRVLYEVSNYGNVKRNGELIELNKKSGYARFGRSYLVHRAVAELFLDNQYNLSDVDHIDGNKFNNNVSNLRWCSRKDNIMNPNTHNNWLIKQHSEECRNKKRIKRLEYLKNNKLATEGCKWMTDNTIEVFLSSDYWGEYIDIGFRFGRLRR